MQELLRLEAGSRRMGAAMAEQGRFIEFCRQHAVTPDVAAVTLYLTYLLDEAELSGGALRYRLRLLDIAAVSEGRQRPSQLPSMRGFLRGLHREAALGPDRNRSPLYRELVQAMLDAIRRDRLQQTRDIALLLLANDTGLPADVLRQLRWDQVKTSRQRLLVTVPHRPRGHGPHGELVVAAGPRPCTVEAIRALRSQVGPVNGPLFTRRDGMPPTMATVSEVIHLLPQRNQGSGGQGAFAPRSTLEPLVAQLGRPRARQLRDAALIALGFAACLTTTEAMALRVGDVRRVPRGLIVQMTARMAPTAIPTTAEPRYCAVTLWDEWRTRLEELDLADGGDAAFPRVRRGAVGGPHIDASNLIRVVHNRCEGAGIVGNYAFTSLRLGFLRTAVRAGVPEHLILRQAGLRWLHSVTLHANRERLISHSVAGRLGL